MRLEPHPSGALWIPECRTVLVADAHLGYGWAQRRRGELGPVRDLASREKLRALLDELQPEEAVFLGDLVHAPQPGVEERAFIEETLRWAAAGRRITVVRGNHDRWFARDFADLGLASTRVWRCGPVAAVHGDRPYATQPGEILVLGHFHPSMTIEDAAGVRVRVRVFLLADDLVVLPAFSPYAAGLNLSRGIPKELRPQLKGREVRVVAATGKRTVALGPLERLARALPAQRYDPAIRKRQP